MTLGLPSTQGAECGRSPQMHEACPEEAEADI